MFDPQSFLDSSVTESNDTVSVPVPAGEYMAVVSSIKARQWQAKDDPANTGVTLDVIWDVDSPEVKELLGRSKVTVKQGIMLDMTPNGTLDMGKGRNVGLGRLRAALDLNTPGEPFSFNMLAGRAAKISVSHRIDGENIFADVKGVAHL